MSVQPDTPKFVTIAGRTTAICLSAVLLWLVLAVQLFVNVDPQAVHRTDAVIMLGGAADERLPAAREIQKELHIHYLVLSHTDTPGNARADQVCDATGLTEAGLICFRPVSMDTRGEAVTIARLIEQNGWNSVTVVTSSYHVTRAELLISQCTAAEVQAVASHPDLNPGQWLHRFVVETLGLLDAAFDPECRPTTR